MLDFLTKLNGFCTSEVYIGRLCQIQFAQSDLLCRMEAAKRLLSRVALFWPEPKHLLEVLQCTDGLFGGSFAIEQFAPGTWLETSDVDIFFHYNALEQDEHGPIVSSRSIASEYIREALTRLGIPFKRTQKWPRSLNKSDYNLKGVLRMEDIEYIYKGRSRTLQLIDVYNSYNRIVEEFWASHTLCFVHPIAAVHMFPESLGTKQSILLPATYSIKADGSREVVKRTKSALAKYKDRGWTFKDLYSGSRRSWNDDRCEIQWFTTCARQIQQFRSILKSYSYIFDPRSVESSKNKEGIEFDLTASLLNWQGEGPQVLCQYATQVLYEKFRFTIQAWLNWTQTSPTAGVWVVRLPQGTQGVVLERIGTPVIQLTPNTTDSEDNDIRGSSHDRSTCQQSQSDSSKLLTSRFNHLSGFPFNSISEP